MILQSEREIFKLIQQRYGIIGSSEAIYEALHKLVQVAPTDLTILITGETGTGKEVFANALHSESNRKKFPFVSVNCGAIPENLLESELFGHEKGAFTSAVDQRKGFFEVANKGTIFLDEIGEMPVGVQVKLLRILETGEFSRLGSSIVHKVDVRIVTATNRELEKEVRAGNFRQDLFFRLNSVQIILPPLRTHPEDIPQLVEYFAWRVGDKMGFKFEGITSDAINILKTLPWPGNVRELRNLTETIVTIERGSTITPDILKRYIPPALPAHDQSPLSPDQSLVLYSREDNQSNRAELGLIFRTLLAIQGEITELRRENHLLYNSFEDLKYNLNNLNLSNQQVAESIIEFPTDTTLNEMEKNMIISALRKFLGNRRAVAKALGISERTLYRKLIEYKLD